MRILIFGSNGMLGRYVFKYLENKYDIIGVTRNDYDIENLNMESLEEFIKKNQSLDVIINCAGVIPQQSKDRDLTKHMYYKINSIFPILLSLISIKLNYKFIHITTDCVFSGKDGNYNELSLHDESNDYGVSKSLGELCLGSIIRTSIIGEEINNFRSLLEWVKSNKFKEINGYVNHYWNGITCLQLAKIINIIISKNLYWNGVRHIYSPSTVNKYQLCQFINNIYKFEIKINPYITEKVDKSISSIYPIMFDIPEIEDQIKEMKNFKL